MPTDVLTEDHLSLDERRLVSELPVPQAGLTMFLIRWTAYQSVILRDITVLSTRRASSVQRPTTPTVRKNCPLMAQHTQDIGLDQTTHAPLSGMLYPNPRISARNRTTHSRRIIVDYSDVYPISAEHECAFNDPTPTNAQNRNPPLYQESKQRAFRQMIRRTTIQYRLVNCSGFITYDTCYLRNEHTAEPCADNEDSYCLGFSPVDRANSYRRRVQISRT